MRVEMTFDDNAAAKHGRKCESVRKAIKTAFAGRALPCVRDDSVLAFSDAGGEDDYAHMWNLIIALLGREWFTDCAASCVFIDDDDSCEDVLSQAWKVRRSPA